MNIEESELHAAKLMEQEEFYEAERLLTSLANQGSAYAMMALAWIYENGRMGTKNVRLAQHYYEHASSLGRIDADFGLGSLLLDNGRENEAREVFERGSERGHLGCIGELGWMKIKGTGGESCEAEGRKMLEEAASHGHLLAQGRIASLELSDDPSFIKRIGLLARRVRVTWKAFFELYRNKNSDKVW